MFKIHTLFSFIILLFIAGCANVVAPTGGPKDTKAPVVVTCNPTNNSVSFKNDIIRINFNEFIKLNNIDNNAIISPLINKEPEYSIKGKSLIIKLNGQLKDSLTYTVLLNNCIADITEGNLNTDLQYVFSTGKYRDSMFIKGKVTDAFTLKPEKDLLVMLYKELQDSVPYKTKPLYVTKTNAEGSFELRNLKNSLYKIFVLKDMNNDLLFNLPNEKIAFSDSNLTPEAIDTIKADSFKSKIYNLRLFQEPDSVQKLLKSFAISKKQFLLPFKYPIKNLKLIPLMTYDLKLTTFFKEFNNNKDTLNVWLKNYDKDSVIFSVSDNNKVLDTIKLNLAQAHRSKTTAKKSGEKLQFNLNVSSSSPFDYYKSIKLLCSTPIKESDFHKIILIEGKDTVKPVIVITDSLKRKTEINYHFKESENYKLFIKPDAFRDIYDVANDTIKVDFKTQSSRSYGAIKIKADFSKANIPLIIQLLNDRENIVREAKIRGKGEINFEHLSPVKYKVKMIFDKNNNGRWDTGNYLKKIQPEKVLFYPNDINCRANWNLEIELKE